jgi:ribonuclease VapC
MIIDTFAILAILFAEDDAKRYADAMAGAEVRLISGANYLEAGVVIGKGNHPARLNFADCFAHALVKTT